MPDLAGQTIAQYQIVERLGRGGQADVYKAFHPNIVQMHNMACRATSTT